MKKKILLWLFVFIVKFNSFAQEKAVDLFNFNINFIGFGMQYEKALSNTITALGSMDYSGGFSYRDNGYNDNFDYIFTTKISLEGRYYYNFSRRILKDKNITNNSGNYLAVKVNYIPDWLTASNNNWEVDPQGSVTFNYGLKRAFAENFFYEFYTGVGMTLYSKYEPRFNVQEQRYQRKKETAVGGAFDFGLRIGYNF